MENVNFGMIAETKSNDALDWSIYLPDENERTSFLVPKATLQRGGHIHVQGRTRSGKSSRILNPLIKSLLHPNESGEQDAVFVFDLGGDLSLLQAAQAQAKLLNRNFKFISLSPDDAWSTFDPLQGMRGDKGQAMAIAEYLASAFSLDHGIFYGGSYFTKKNIATLLDVAKQLDEQGETASLASIVERLRRKGSDAAEVAMCFRVLLEFPQLCKRLDGNEINFASALESGEVIYFFMPTLSGANSARQVAALGMYSALLACMKRVNENKKKRNVYFIIDEFQELVSRSFSALLSQCGKYGVTLVMANQTTSQLENRDVNVADVVRDNTILKLYLTFTTQKDLEGMQLLAKDTVSTLQSRTKSGTVQIGQGQETDRDVIISSLQKNLALEVSAKEGYFLAFYDNGKGHNAPKVVYAEHGDLENTFELGFQIPKRDNSDLFSSKPIEHMGEGWQANHTGDPEHSERQRKLFENIARKGETDDS